ncbi:contractile injection system protein, VgrG/Pvc8 family [Undibacterium umbellatum]|uniref:Phage late control D family protein n=1 Tax=Undibacterium umbellatum TaxID=2762300 RepID=A0ABR6ZIN4_9BURK|nr:contractile injection system protein, VgrG/Pvc8 family [Undibacterium umbellatum]MBC3911569.1 phage late control D family protein [Undibacterium umbellatum]
MSHNKPAFAITLDDQDITSKIYPRLVSLTLTEARENAVDELNITIDDSDGRVAIPRKGVKITLQLGWEHSGMVDKGSFVVDEVEHEGAPDMLVLRARSAEMAKPVRTRKDRSFDKKTVADIVGQIAKDNGLTPKVSQSLQSKIIDHIDQTNESDINFLNRLGKRFDAVATVKKDALLFLPIDEGSNSKGESLPTITLERRDGDKHRYHTASRDAYSGVRAQWHDPNDAKEKSELIGEDDNPKRLRHTYPNQEAAEQAAKAEMNRVKRGKATLQFTLALGRPDITPMMGVRIPSLKAPIGDTDWIIVKTTHSVTAQGFTTQLELETRKGQEEKDAGAVEESEQK